MDILSFMVGIMSIILGAYSIWYARKESKQSEENYNKTKMLLDEIDKKTTIIDNGVQQQQEQQFKVINKLLEIVDERTIEMKPLTLDELNELFENTTVKAEVPNKAGGTTVVIDNVKNIVDVIAEELSKI